jgi:hypothetical protein
VHIRSWIRILAGAVIGSVGLVILARLDIPDIRGGGIVGVLAAADLAFFTVLLVAALTVASVYGDEDTY